MYNSILFLFGIWKPTNTDSRSIFKEAFTDRGDIGAKNEIDRDIIKHNIILLFHNLCLQGHLVFDSISQNNYIFFRFLFYVPR